MGDNALHSRLVQQVGADGFDPPPRAVLVPEANLSRYTRTWLLQHLGEKVHHGFLVIRMNQFEHVSPDSFLDRVAKM